MLGGQCCAHPWGHPGHPCARVPGSRTWQDWQWSLPAGKTRWDFNSKPPEGARGRGGTFQQQLRFGSQLVGGGNWGARWRNPSLGRGAAKEKKNPSVFALIEKAPERCFFHQHLSALFMQSTDLFCKLLSGGNASEGEGQVDPAGGETSFKCFVHTILRKAGGESKGTPRPAAGPSLG